MALLSASSPVLPFGYWRKLHNQFNISSTSKCPVALDERKPAEMEIVNFFQAPTRTMRGSPVPGNGDEQMMICFVIQVNPELTYNRPPHLRIRGEMSPSRSGRLAFAPCFSVSFSCSRNYATERQCRLEGEVLSHLARGLRYPSPCVV